MASETLDGLAIDPASLVTEPQPAVTRPIHQPGDQVRCPRGGKPMVVLASKSPVEHGMKHDKHMHQCMEDGWPHPRWFREDDLVKA